MTSERFAAEASPFTRQDLDRVTQLVTAAWRAGIDRDWSALAGTLEWSCSKTADHAVDAVLAVAFFLASRRQDAYPEWALRVLTAGSEAQPQDLIEGLEIASRVLSGVIATSDPETRAVIRRRPVATGTPNDFAARGALEMILHGHDVCAGLGVSFDPPADVCTRLREHTRAWPAWSRPPWKLLPSTDKPWSDLLVGSGRMPTP